MKTFVLASTMALALVSGQAMAACGTGGFKRMFAVVPVPIGSASNLALGTLSGKTVCVGAAPTWQAQEYHETGGSLIDYKRGPVAPGNIDPTETVGSWSIVGDQINYVYKSGGNYTYDVYEKNGAYSFCSGASSAAEATIRTGQVAC